MTNIDISDFADLSREHNDAVHGVQRAINRLEEIMSDSRAWRKRDGNTVEHYRLRRDLPYCIHPTQTEGTSILVNRNYKPIGSNIPTGGVNAVYEDYTNSHVNLTAEQIATVVTLPHKNGYLFGDADAPWRNTKSARAYLKRLHQLLKLLVAARQTLFESDRTNLELLAS